MNLQNPNSVDTLAINGLNNYLSQANSAGINNWGVRFVQGNAFNYAPPVAPPIAPPVAPPVVLPAALPQPSVSSPVFSAGSLVQAVQMQLKSFVPPACEFKVPTTAVTLVGNVTVEQTAVSESGSVDDSETPAQNDSLTTVPAGNQINADVDNVQTVGEREIEIRHEVMLSDGPATLSSVATQNGFSLTLPEGLMLVPTALREANLIVRTGMKPRALSLSQVLNAIVEGGSSAGNRSTPSDMTAGALRMVMADGSPLPAWLVFDPITKTLSAKEIPEGTEPLKIKLQTFNGDVVLGESEISIDTNESLK
jgi:hypothetical protein